MKVQVVLLLLIVLSEASVNYRWSHKKLWSKKAEGGKVLIVYSGGTIGMLKTEKGLAPQKGYLANVLRSMPELQKDTSVAYDIVELNPLLDSSSIAPSDWKRIGDVINKYYDKYDGFVVLHGTDTMQYTASALSFMFENLDKTIVVTGSQIPISESFTDAKNNIITSLNVAAHLDIKEVVLVFGGVMLRGNRAAKTSASSLQGFSSLNFQPLAKLDLKIHYRYEHVIHPKGKMVYHPEISNEVVVLTLYPGITGTTVRNMLKEGVKGVVIQAFGEGNAPENEDFIKALEEANKRGIVLVDTTQCGNGNVNMDSYAAGSGLKRAGVVNGRDMTVSAAFTKLASLIGRGFASEKVKEIMATNVVGEMTVPSKKEN